MSKAIKFLGLVYWRIPGTKHPYVYPFVYALAFVSLGLVSALKDPVLRPYPALADLYSVQGTLKEVISKRRGVVIVVTDDASGIDYRFPGKRNHLNVSASERRHFTNSIGDAVSVKWRDEFFPFNFLNDRKDIWDLRVNNYSYREYEKRLRGTKKRYHIFAGLFYVSAFSLIVCVFGPIIFFRKEALINLQEGNYD